MSADNGIYIGHFTDGEIRVIHAQAIENCWYPDGENAEAIVSYFGDAHVFTNLSDAMKCAFDMEKDILTDDFCSILEYGISTLKFTKPFSEYLLEVKGAEFMQGLMIIEASDRFYITDASGTARVLKYKPEHWAAKKHPVLCTELAIEDFERFVQR